MAAGRSSGRYAAAKLTFSPLLRVVVPLPPSSLPSPSQQTHNPSDLGSSHPYINHSLIPLATHYIGSIDFSLLQQRWRGNPPQWSHTHTGSGKTSHGCVSLDRNGGFSSFRHNNAERKSMHKLHDRGEKFSVLISICYLQSQV